MTILVDNPKLEQDIPIDRIHPDPFQPRLEPDADLADSIKSQGVLQAILVEQIDATNSAERVCPDCGVLFVVLQVEGGHFMIQDGERRYRGSVAGGRKTVLAKVVPAVTETERLLRQLTANTGKPLSPVEEAFAFKRLMDESGCNQVELARMLGRPRSVVGDRIRLVELDEAWLELLTSGKLQVSHAAILSAFSAVPSEYQKKAAANFVGDYRVKRYIDHGGTVPVDEMPRLLYVSFRDYIKPIDRTPGYRGPTIEIKDQYSDRKSKYAADIKAWRPCFNAYERKRKKEQGPRSSGSHYVDRTPIELAMKALEKAGIDVPSRPAGKTRALPGDGEAVILHEHRGWAEDIHPKVLLEKIDPRKIIFVQNFGGDELWTSDIAAVNAARDAFRRHKEEATAAALEKLRGELTTRVISTHAVSGPGVTFLLRSIGVERGPARVVALALGLPVYPAENSMSQTNVEKILSALAAIGDRKITVPQDYQIEERVSSVRKSVVFKLPEPPKSKTQQKRDARAAGKQVGDPERAKKDREVPIAAASETLEDPEGEFVEADLEFEEANA